MRIERISFASSAVGAKNIDLTKKENSDKSENVKSNNTSKYLVGTVAGAAVLTGMVIAGRRGYLGNKVQKLLGGAEKIKSKTNTVKIQDADDTIKEVVKRQETSDIIKDGKKTGVVIKDYENDNLVLTTTKTLDENGNVVRIDEKYAGVRKIEIRKTTVNHNNHDYTVWRYFEIPEKGTGKSINFKLYDNNDYSYDLICVYPNEIEAIKQKLAENGVKFGKCLTNYGN